MGDVDMKTVYLSGPMTGYKDFNYPAFNQLEQDIKELDPSITVINPTQTGVQEGWEWNDYLAHDLKLLLDGKPDAVITLPDWERSRGAKLEVHVAKQLGVQVIPDKRFISMLRGNIFKRPTAIYRKHDYSIFSIEEYEQAISSLDYFKYEHEQDPSQTGEFPLVLIELPIDLPVDGLNPNATDGKTVNLPNWIKSQVEGVDTLTESKPSTDPTNPIYFEKWLKEQ